jgi:hypothetical protein
MKQFFIIIISAFLFISCNKKNLKLPLNNIKGIQDTIYNNSKIWIFFKQENQDTIALLNRNNKLVNTHYIYNIDKRLKLKHIIDKLNKIQFKKEQPSMHSNGEYMHSYLSYVDTKTKKLSMVLFDSVKFFPLEEMLDSKNQLLINYSNTKLQLNTKNIELDNLQKELYIYKDSSYSVLNLIISNEVTYDNYIKLKANLQQLKIDSIFVNKKEYIK